MARKKKTTSKRPPANATKKRVQKTTAKSAVTKAAQADAPVVVPEKVAETAIKTEAKRVRRKPQVPTAETVPVRPRFTLAESLALAAGGVFLVVGIVGILQRPDTSLPDTSVKQQNIPMTLDDFKGDPAIQNAIQKQLGGNQQQTAPQEQQTQSPQNAGGSLQSPAGNLQQ